MILRALDDPAGPTKRWFGGDVSALYRAFGERFPASPERVRLVPEDAESFVRRVYSALGGVEVGSYPPRQDRQQIEEHNRKYTENRKKSELANMALDYLRLEETLDKAPMLKEFGKRRFAHRAEEASLGADVEEAWARYASAISDALAHNETAKESGRDI